MRQIRRLEPGNSVGVWILAVDLVAGGRTSRNVGGSKKGKANTGKQWLLKYGLVKFVVFFEFTLLGTITFPLKSQF